MAQRILEISDLVIDRDPATLARVPVRRDAVVAELIAAGDRRGARIVAGMPAPQGVLVPEAVDRLLVRAHTELQRLNEELRMPEQLAELLRPILQAVSQPGQRTRVVDIGCGLGYTLRWLAANDALPGVELCGVDFNEALVERAGQLADADGLECRFIHGDAFALPETATVFISSGVLHHLRGKELAEFFRAQAGAGARAYCHFDIAATRLAPIGAWIFHQARMREPLGRHDGVASARRAHPDAELLTAAECAQSLVPLLYRPVRHTNPFCASVRPILGIVPDRLGALRTALGRNARHLVAAVPPTGRLPW